MGFMVEIRPLVYFMASIMLFLGKAPEATLQLLERLDLLSERLLSDLNIPVVQHTLPANAQVFDGFSKEQLGVIRTGMITVVNDGNDTLCLQPGDIIGLNRVFGLPHEEFRVDEGVEIDLMQRDEFMGFIGSDPVRQHRFSNYLLTSMALYQSLLAHYQQQSQVATHTGFQHVANGEVMIQEGDYADTVYQLMSGSADVSVNGVTVGEVLSGEIFGAMAVFTGEKRNATVTARENCQLLAIPKQEFVTLIKAQPEIAMTLLDNMSRRIKALNEQVTNGERQIA